MPKKNSGRNLKVKVFKKATKSRKRVKNSPVQEASTSACDVESSPLKHRKKGKNTNDNCKVKAKGATQSKVKSAESDSRTTMNVLRSKSEGLVKKLSNLRIGPPNRISPSCSLPILVRKPRHLSTYTVSSLNHLADLVTEGKCRNIIVMVGAGLSTASGIPDFRTPGSGLYDNLEEYNLPYPTAVFDIDYFAVNPRPFFRLAKELYPGRFQPNYAHFFLRVMHEKGLLLRLYTQNIDALERIAGIPSDKLVEAHGSFASATCRRCLAKYDGNQIKEQVINDKIPHCLRSGCKGIIKPDIVFFGEDLPRRFYKFRTDFQLCDLLVVLGTSLEVEPFAGLAYEVKNSTPRLLVNREIVGPFRESERRSNDVVCKGDLIEKLRLFAELLRWTKDVEKHVSKVKA